jgi:hypothetical protein
MAVREEIFRYDVISIVTPPGKAVEISLLRGYFNENQFTRNTGISTQT